MKKALIFCIICLLFIACQNQNSEINTIRVSDNKNFNDQQWSINKNNDFYSSNNINTNANINAKDLLKKYSGKGVKIAIIDDALDINHHELKGKIISSYDINTKTSNVLYTNSRQYHGTAVTGIIASNNDGIGISGIASDAQIIFLKLKENMSDSQTLELFSKAQEFGADIINCSWGTYDVSDIVKEKINYLSKYGRDGKGIIFVFASGNDNIDIKNDESSIENVISVGASDEDNYRALYSNHGKNLDILAPGGYYIGITTLDLMGKNGIATLNDDYILHNDNYSFNGTSASAPIVSGIIALMLEKNNNLTKNEIETILKNTSDKIGNIPYTNNRNNYYGYGKVNLQKIMQAIN